MKLINALEEFLKEYETHVPKEKVEEICKDYFIFAKKMMEDFKQVRFRYLGAFVIFPGRVKGVLSKKKRKLLNNRITEEQYKQDEKNLINLLKELEYDNKNSIEESF